MEKFRKPISVSIPGVNVLGPQPTTTAVNIAETHKKAEWITTATADIRNAGNE